jgi:hypothetical protein
VYFFAERLKSCIIVSHGLDEARMNPKTEKGMLNIFLVHS